MITQSIKGSTWAMNPIPPRCLGGGCREGSGCTPCPGSPHCRQYDHDHNIGVIGIMIIIIMIMIIPRHPWQRLHLMRRHPWSVFWSAVSWGAAEWDLFRWRSYILSTDHPHHHDTGNQPSKWGPVSVVDTLLVPENIPAGKWVAMMVNDNNMMMWWKWVVSSWLWYDSQMNLTTHAYYCQVCTGLENGLWGNCSGKFFFRLPW